MQVVPTFTVVRSTGEVSGFTPAASSWLRRRHSPRPTGPDTYHRSDSSPPPLQGAKMHRAPALIHRVSSWSTIKRLYDTGSLRTPSRLAHQTRPIRQYWTVLTLSRLLPPTPGVPRGQAAASFTQPLRRPGHAGLPPPSDTTAPRGAPRAHRPRPPSPPRAVLDDRSRPADRAL